MGERSNVFRMRVSAVEEEALSAVATLMGLTRSEAVRHAVQEKLATFTSLCRKLALLHDGTELQEGEIPAYLARIGVRSRADFARWSAPLIRKAT